jgi:hypothetical protein
MAGTADDHSDLAHTIDDLFRLLTRVRDIPPAIARVEILEQARRGRLQIDLHIRGGARKILPLRPATERELREGRPIGAPEGAALEMWHVYETAPPEGITDRVHGQDWGRLLNLLVCDDERLIVELDSTFEYPESAYSFTVANWPLVAELWPQNSPAVPPTAITPATAPLVPEPKSPAEPALAAGGTEAWVFNYVRDNPPKRGDRTYVDRVWRKCPTGVTKKTIQTLVGKHRKRFEVPD